MTRVWSIIDFFIAPHKTIRMETQPFSETLLPTESSAQVSIPNAQKKRQALQRRMAWEDIIGGIGAFRVWFMLAYQDIQLRYRRSVLGPLWITLSMAISLYSMGYLYSFIFHIDLQQYYPYLIAGMLGWTLIAMLTIDYADGFVFYHALIKQLKLPYTVHIHRIAARNILIFMHNLLVIVPIYIIFNRSNMVNWHLLLLIPSLILLYINAIIYGTIIAMVGARYRDMSQLIKSIIQVIFFITPVMWKPDMLTGHQHWIVDLNPLYAMLELIRAPLLGQTPLLVHVLMTLGFTLIGAAIFTRLLVRYRSRIIYWL